MREIEIKARLRDRSGVIGKLKELGLSISEPIFQRDQVFFVPGTRGDDENTQPWLRIRTERYESIEKHLFTLKKSVHGQNDSIECETEIAEPKEMERAIREMNFEEYVTVAKTREKIRDGEYEICLDSVEGIGDFIEVEKLVAEGADHYLVASKLWKYFEKLGIDRNDEVTDGYDVLVRKAQGRAS